MRSNIFSMKALRLALLSMFITSTIIGVNSCRDEFDEKEALELEHAFLLQLQQQRDDARRQALLDSVQAAQAAAQQAATDERAKIQLQADLQAARDALFLKGGSINYAVNVVDGNSTTFSGSTSNNQRTSSEDMSGFVVSVFHQELGTLNNGTTDASGMVVFPDLRVGKVTVNILNPNGGFTPVNYVADITPSSPFEKPTAVGAGDSPAGDPNGYVRSAGTVVPVFGIALGNVFDGTQSVPLAQLNRYSTVKGKMNIETDLTDFDREIAPAGTIVSLSIDSDDATFLNVINRATNNTFGSTDGNSNGTDSGSEGSVAPGEGNNFEDKAEGDGRIIQLTYSDATFTGVINEAGEYTVIVPSFPTGNGLPMVVNHSTVAADQTLYDVVSRTNNEAGGSAVYGVVTKRAVFGANSAPTTMPDFDAVDVTVTSPLANVDANGASAKAYLGDADGGITSVVISNGGHGYYAAPYVFIPHPTDVMTAGVDNNGDGDFLDVNGTDGNGNGVVDPANDTGVDGNGDGLFNLNLGAPDNWRLNPAGRLEDGGGVVNPQTIAMWVGGVINPQLFAANNPDVNVDLVLAGSDGFDDRTGSVIADDVTTNVAAIATGFQTYDVRPDVAPDVAPTVTVNANQNGGEGVVVDLTPSAFADPNSPLFNDDFARATATVTDGKVTGVTIDYAGEGYVPSAGQSTLPVQFIPRGTAPTFSVQIDAGGGVIAAATTVEISGGFTQVPSVSASSSKLNGNYTTTVDAATGVATVAINNEITGLGDATTVTFTATSAVETMMKLRPVVAIDGGSINSLTIADGTYGLATTAPFNPATGLGAAADVKTDDLVGGSATQENVLAGQYSQPPLIEITGTGTGATAKATLNSSGQVDNVAVVGGSGYDQPNTTITVKSSVTTQATFLAKFVPVNGASTLAESGSSTANKTASRTTSTVTSGAFYTKAEIDAFNLDNTSNGLVTLEASYGTGTSAVTVAPVKQDNDALFVNAGGTPLNPFYSYNAATATNTADSNVDESSKPTPGINFVSGGQGYFEDVPLSIKADKAGGSTTDSAEFVYELGNGYVTGVTLSSAATYENGATVNAATDGPFSIITGGTTDQNSGAGGATALNFAVPVTNEGKPTLADGGQVTFSEQSAGTGIRFVDFDPGTLTKNTLYTYTPELRIESSATPGGFEYQVNMLFDKLFPPTLEDFVIQSPASSSMAFNASGPYNYDGANGVANGYDADAAGTDPDFRVLVDAIVAGAAPTTAGAVRITFRDVQAATTRATNPVTAAEFTATGTVSVSGTAPDASVIIRLNPNSFQSTDVKGANYDASNINTVALAISEVRSVTTDGSFQKVTFTSSGNGDAIVDGDDDELTAINFGSGIRDVALGPNPPNAVPDEEEQTRIFPLLVKSDLPQTTTTYPNSYEGATTPAEAQNGDATEGVVQALLVTRLGGQLGIDANGDGDFADGGDTYPITALRNGLGYSDANITTLEIVTSGNAQDNNDGDTPAKADFAITYTPTDNSSASFVGTVTASGNSFPFRRDANGVQVPAKNFVRLVRSTYNGSQITANLIDNDMVIDEDDVDSITVARAIKYIRFRPAPLAVHTNVANAVTTLLKSDGNGGTTAIAIGDDISAILSPTKVINDGTSDRTFAFLDGDGDGKVSALPTTAAELREITENDKPGFDYWGYVGTGYTNEDPASTSIVPFDLTISNQVFVAGVKTDPAQAQVISQGFAISSIEIKSGKVIHPIVARRTNAYIASPADAVLSEALAPSFKLTAKAPTGTAAFGTPTAATFPTATNLDFDPTDLTNNTAEANEINYPFNIISNTQAYELNSVEITDGGAGYADANAAQNITAPFFRVVFDSDDVKVTGVPQGTAAVTAGAISGVTVSNAGSFIDGDATAALDFDGAVGNQEVSTDGNVAAFPNVILNDFITKLYLQEENGLGSIGTARAVKLDGVGKVVGVIVDNPGAGYTAPPKLMVIPKGEDFNDLNTDGLYQSGEVKEGAKMATITFTGDVADGVTSSDFTVTDGGEGYTLDPDLVVLTHTNEYIAAPRNSDNPVFFEATKNPNSAILYQANAAIVNDPYTATGSTTNVDAAYTDLGADGVIGGGDDVLATVSDILGTANGATAGIRAFVVENDASTSFKEEEATIGTANNTTYTLNTAAFTNGTANSTTANDVKNPIDLRDVAARLGYLFTGSTKATAETNRGTVTSITVTGRGDGLVDNTYPVNIFGGGTLATGATASVVISDGMAPAIGTVIATTTSGTGYEKAPSNGAPAVDAKFEMGSGATGEAIASPLTVSSIEVTSGGAGYADEPFAVRVVPGTTDLGGVTQEAFLNNPELVEGIVETQVSAVTVDATTGAITSITVDPANPGAGYTSAPTVVIEDFETILRREAAAAFADGNFDQQFPGGFDFERFVTAEVAVEVDAATGAITSADIVNPGFGYLTGTPEVRVLGTGEGAVITAAGIDFGTATGGQQTGVGDYFNRFGSYFLNLDPATTGSVSATKVPSINFADHRIKGITITSGGSGYFGGNFPRMEQPFKATLGSALQFDVNVPAGTTLIHDIYYGTGTRNGSEVNDNGSNGRESAGDNQ